MPEKAVLPDGEIAVLHELVKLARANLPDATWDYLMGGADTETTLRRNRAALDRLALRPRVLRDVSRIDPGARFLGLEARLPVFLAPIGSLQDLHPGGGATAALAAAEFGVPMMLSSVCAPGLEEVAVAAAGPKLYQLYVRGDAAWVDAQVDRAVEAGYRGFALTVDLDQYGRRERDLAKRVVPTARRGATGHEHQERFGWSDVARIRARCPVPLILKGIATAEDAAIALDHGVDGIYVSNHGGRQLDHGRGAVEILPEVVEQVAGRAAVLVDGGFMRGTDVVKALALGADAVGLGRLFGLAIAADGREGVVRMLEILEREVRIALGLLGVNRPDELDRSHLHPAEPASFPAPLGAFPLLEEGY